MSGQEKPLRTPALDPAQVPATAGTIYPEKFKAQCAGRLKQVLGDPLGLTRFGVNIVTLPPGVWSAHRHWHEREEEFVYVIDGAVTLVTDAGEQVLTSGQVAGFPAGRADGHHLINKTRTPARYLVVGTRCDDETAVYPDIDLHLERKGGRNVFSDKSGTPY